ncbi:MAG: putative tail protein [Caudoviricetes sp.]|nr:MAG: putative tail protein [Caudoviricetes sp.]
MANTPNTAIWNAASEYVQGLRLTYATTTTFTVDQGAARDSTNNNDIILSLPPLNDGTPVLTPFTIRTTVNGAGGLDVGTIAASTLYYVYVIASSNSKINLPPSPILSQTIPPFAPAPPSAPVQQDGYYVQANVMISTSSTAPVLPFGYDMFRRIGAVSTNGSSQFRKFVQTGYGANRTMWYDAGVSVLAAGAAQAYATIDVVSAGLVAQLLPSSALETLLQVTFTPAAVGNSVSFQPFGGTGAYATLSAVAVQAQSSQLRCPAGLNALVPVINYQNSAAACATSVLIQGYVDQL